MNRLLLTALAACLLPAATPGSPRTIDKGKPAPMPAGRYVLAGAAEAARGDDVFELMKDFYLRDGQFVLSGGPNPTDRITVDDDLEVWSGEAKLFIDDDGLSSLNSRGKQAAVYQGFPIVVVADPAKKLRVRAKGASSPAGALGEVWLHRVDGAKVKLTGGVKKAAEGPFFDEQYDLMKVFDAPAKPRVVAGTPDTLPESPSSLLPRFRDKK